MVNLILKEGNRHVDPSWDARPVIVEISKSMAQSRIQRLNCPVHKSQSRATLLLDVGSGRVSWQILDYCCESFRRTLAQKMPKPLSRNNIDRFHKAA